MANFFTRHEREKCKSNFYEGRVKMQICYVVLLVNPTNQGAIRLYEKIGYYVDKSHYAPNSEVEIIMRHPDRRLQKIHSQCL
jgi:ribosomal protein S18 acetylase RimI-like enzyme